LWYFQSCGYDWSLVIAVISTQRSTATKFKLKTIEYMAACCVDWVKLHFKKYTPVKNPVVTFFLILYVWQVQRKVEPLASETERNNRNVF
jgi:hypothetical protein